MQPLELILNALAAGAQSGLENVTGRAIGEIYQRLVERVRERLAACFSTDKVERAENAIRDAKALGKDAGELPAMLRLADVEKDQEIQALAQELLSQLKHPAASGKIQQHVEVSGGENVAVIGSVSGAVNFTKRSDA